MAGLFVLLWLSLTTVTFAPWWVVTLLVLLLVPQAVAVARLARSRPERCVLVPAAGFVVWLGIVLAV